MINFASLFSQFRNNSNSAISQLLEQPNADLPKLLDEDSFVNQYKSGSSKLMEYMKYDKFVTLVQYITVVGPAQDRRRSYKFPLSASDILSSQNNTAIQYFLPDGKLCIDEITYEEQEIEVQVQQDSPVGDAKSQEKKSDQKQPQEPQKTIIQDNLDQPTQPGSQAQAKKQEESSKKDQNSQKKVQQSTQKLEVTEQESSQTKQEVTQTPKKKKIVKQIKQVQKINKKEVIPLINLLFKYFEGQINYTLAGYVCKVLSMLLTKKTNYLMKFILENPNNRKALLNHVQSRSVAQFITKILTLENTDLIPERANFYKQMIAKLGINAQVFVLSNLSACVSQTIEKCVVNLKSANAIKQFSTVFFSPEDIATVINHVMSEEENVSVYNAPVLYIYLTNVPLNAPQNQVLLKNFKQMLEGFISKAEQKLKVTKQQRKALGFGRIKILQILSFILKQNILEAQDVIAKKDNFFNILFKLCQNYEMNNVLHNEVVKIIEIALTLSSESAFLKCLTENDVLLNFLLKEHKEDSLIKGGQGNTKTRKGYIGHIVLICQKIKQFSAKNDLLNRLTERTQFQQIMENLVEKETFQANKNLAGFSMRKNQPQKIMFQKEEVISQYITFLSKTIEPVFEPQPDPINIQHPDLLTQLQEQLQQNIKLRDEQIKQEQKLSKQLEERGNPKYWIKHLNYDVDQLMSQL